MPASAPSRRRLRSGFATVCLVLIELSQAACGGENDRRQSSSRSPSSFISALPVDSLWGPDAPAIKAAMDKQIGDLMSRALADWALLDSLGISTPGSESSGLEPKPAGFGTVRIILASSPRPPPVALDRTTREHSTGPTTANGATLEAREKVTLWDEGGKIGMSLELRSTTTRVTDATTTRTVRDLMQRTEVKFCPDPQGM